MDQVRKARGGIPSHLFWIVLCLRICLRVGAIQTAAVALVIMHHLDLTEHKKTILSCSLDICYMCICTCINLNTRTQHRNLQLSHAGTRCWFEICYFSSQPKTMTDYYKTPSTRHGDEDVSD